MASNSSRRLSTFLVILALCTLSVSAEVFLSIDCGSALGYKDDNLIDWIGDDEYVKTGESVVVNPSNSLSHVMDSLRVFKNRRKNCYHMNSIKQGRVLVRATFYYGNYDGKSSPPSFDLSYDGNRWVTVETSMNGLVYYEVTYVMKSDSISVCVSQVYDGEYPFISAIEVRSLETYVYNRIDENYPLFLMRRLAYGAKATVRYPDDRYDRVWTPQNAAQGKNVMDISGNATFGGFTGLGDNPPPAVLKSAITLSEVNSTDGILLGNLGFPNVEIPIYITFYFSEVIRLDPGQKRSFTIIKDGAVFSEPVEPPYGNFSELYASNTTVSSNTTFALLPTNVSTLAPLINALEVFMVGDALTDGTNRRDVEGLTALQNAFSVLESWSGDPCLPAPYSWDWINCTYDHDIPRVTALFLGSFGLSGGIPDFSSMTALETIDLHNNSLNGSIPDFLGTLPRLKQLNLADNDFSGSIPTSLSQKNDLNIVVTGNPELCTLGGSCSKSPSAKRKKKNKNKLPIVLGIAIPSFVIIWAIVGVAIFLRNKRKTAVAAAQISGQEEIGGNGYVGRAVSPLMKGHRVNMKKEDTKPTGV